jgi:hypothetical protein
MTDQIQIDFDGEAGELTREELHILRLLEPGRKAARSVRYLASMVGVPETRLRELVRHLIDDHGACIGSRTGSPPGYYVIEDPDEIEEVYRSLRHRGISILMRAARLKKTSLAEVFGQGEL